MRGKKEGGRKGLNKQGREGGKKEGKEEEIHKARGYEWSSRKVHGRMKIERRAAGKRNREVRGEREREGRKAKTVKRERVET